MPFIEWPELPRSNSQEGSEAITRLFAERNYPAAPNACARAGYEACYRIARQQRLMMTAVQVADEHYGYWSEVRDALHRVRETACRSPGLPEPQRVQVLECLERLHQLLPIGPEPGSGQLFQPEQLSLFSLSGTEGD